MLSIHIKPLRLMLSNFYILYTLLKMLARLVYSPERSHIFALATQMTVVAFPFIENKSLNIMTITVIRFWINLDNVPAKTTCKTFRHLSHVGKPEFISFDFFFFTSLPFSVVDLSLSHHFDDSPSTTLNAHSSYSSLVCHTENHRNS